MSCSVTGTLTILISWRPHDDTTHSFTSEFQQQITEHNSSPLNKKFIRTALTIALADCGINIPVVYGLMLCPTFSFNSDKDCIKQCLEVKLTKYLITDSDSAAVKSVVLLLGLPGGLGLSMINPLNALLLHKYLKVFKSYLHEWIYNKMGQLECNYETAFKDHIWELRFWHRTSIFTEDQNWWKTSLILVHITFRRELSSEGHLLRWHPQNFHEGVCFRWGSLRTCICLWCGLGAVLVLVLV